MSSTTCTSLPAREGAHHCRYHSKVQSTGPPAYNTMCGGCTTAIQYKSAHQLCASQRAVEQRSPVVCFTESSGERGRRLSGVERRVVSDNAATDGGRWRSARSDDAGRGKCWRRVSGRCSFWCWERRAELTLRGDGGGGIGWRCCVAVLRCQTVL